MWLWWHCLDGSASDRIEPSKASMLGQLPRCHENTPHMPTNHKSEHVFGWTQKSIWNREWHQSSEAAKYSVHYIMYHLWRAGSCQAIARQTMLRVYVTESTTFAAQDPFKPFKRFVIFAKLAPCVGAFCQIGAMLVLLSSAMRLLSRVWRWFHKGSWNLNQNL